MSEHTEGVMKHKQLVKSYLDAVAYDLIKRAVVHDDSKFSPEELADFERMTPILKTLTYGSAEYKEALKELGPALEHHYRVNDHHPEHFKDGVNGMNLMQLTEMVCDWMAATRRVNDGNFFTSLEVNKERFGLSDQLYEIIKNTIIALKNMG